MAYFKEGDVVTIRYDLEPDNGVSSPFRYAMDDGSAEWDVTGWMATQAGERVVIYQPYSNGYKLRDKSCVWTDEMFEEYAHRYDDIGEFEPASPADILSMMGG